MPPRFTYWTIILDGQPTAFRAADRETLLPTLKQLQRKNPDAALKWFARGRVWESPEEARLAWSEGRKRPVAEAPPSSPPAARRGREWRPGGEHRDPRQRFKKETFQARKRREKKAAALGRPVEREGARGTSVPHHGGPRPGRSPRWERDGRPPQARSDPNARSDARTPGAARRPDRGGRRESDPRLRGEWRGQEGRGGGSGFRPRDPQHGRVGKPWHGRRGEDAGRAPSPREPWPREPDSRPRRPKESTSPAPPETPRVPEPPMPVVSAPPAPPVATRDPVVAEEPGRPVPPHRTRMPRLRKKD